MEHLLNDHVDHPIQHKDSYTMTTGAMQWLLQHLQELWGTPDADSIHFALYDLHHFIISVVFSTCREVMVETNQW